MKNIRVYIKTLLAENEMTVTKMAEELSKRLGKPYTQSNLSQKLMRNTLKFDEAILIGEILGYELKYIRVKPYKY